MIQLIIGDKGSGKTKKMVDQINASLATNKGNIVCVEKGAKLTFDLSYKVRLTDVDHYKVSGYDAFYGFLAGMMAGNYDISEIYVDGILKVVGRDYEALGTLFDKLDVLSNEVDTKLIITVSADAKDLPASVMKYA